MSEIEGARVVLGHGTCASCGRLRADRNLVTTRVDAPGDLFCHPSCDEPRELREIAGVIRRDWLNVYFGAEPYLRAMRWLSKITDMYGQDDADSIVRHFLVNAKTWRGETARAVKAELKGMLER